MDKNKTRRINAIRALIQAGWSPPPPNERIVDAITDDIQRIRQERVFGGHDAPTLDLSPSLLRCLLLISEGHTDREAAKIVGIGVYTMKSQAKEVSRRLGAKNRAHAVAIAFRQGIIT